MTREEILFVIQNLPANVKLKKEIQSDVLSHNKLYVVTNILVGKDDKVLYAKLLGYKKGYRLSSFDYFPIRPN